MSISLGRTIATLAVAAGLAVGTAGVASAQTLSVADAAGDVQSVDLTSNQPTVTPQPTVTNGDIVNTVFTHSLRRINVTVQFADLQKVGVFRGDFLEVKTNEGVRRDVLLFAAKGHWRGRMMMVRRDGTQVHCRLDHSIDYDSNIVTLGFPRGCVSKPRWVKLGLGSVWADDKTMYADDSQLTGGLDQSSDDLTLSPRLRRG